MIKTTRCDLIWFNVHDAVRCEMTSAIYSVEKNLTICYEMKSARFFSELYFDVITYTRFLSSKICSYRIVVCTQPIFNRIENVGVGIMCCYADDYSCYMVTAKTSNHPTLYNFTNR